MRVLLTGKKFTAFTRSATALGSSKLPRYYAVIEMDGGGLAVLLVKHGFARVHSTKVNHPDGTKADDYIETLAEMEKSAEAAKAGLCLPFLGRRWRRPRFNLVGLWMSVGPEFNRRHEFECLPFWWPFLPRQSQPLPATQDGCIRRRGLARTLVICSPDHRPRRRRIHKVVPPRKTKQPLAAHACRFACAVRCKNFRPSLFYSLCWPCRSQIQRRYGRFENQWFLRERECSCASSACGLATISPRPRLRFFRVGIMRTSSPRHRGERPRTSASAHPLVGGSECRHESPARLLAPGSTIPFP